MKRVLNYILSAAAVLSMSACEFEYPVKPYMAPDPGFQASGLQAFPTISIYPETDVTLELSRNFGLSKAMDVNLNINEALIEEYNSLYNTKYSLMPEKYYELDRSVSFAENTNVLNIPVKIFTDELVKQEGLDAANLMVIPVEIGETSEKAKDPGTMGNVLLNLNIDKPIIEVSEPQKQSQKLEFVPVIPLPQTISLKANANFTTLDIDKVAYEADESLVAEYNAANGTDYKILPANKYTIKEGKFDKETMEYTTDVEFDCSSIGGTDRYAVALMLKDKAGYVTVQSEPVYVFVEMSELRVWPSDKGQIIVSSTGLGTIEIAMNSPMLEDQPINLIYEPEKVAEYNAANSTSYKPLDASLVAITASKIEVGNQRGSVGFEIDYSTIAYDDLDNQFLLPLSIDPSCLVPGTTVEEASTVYVKVNKTCTGTYTKGDYTSVFQARNENKFTERTIYLADGKTIPSGASDVVEASGMGHKYAVFYSRTNLHLYFNISDEEVPEHPGCLKLTDLRDRKEGYDEITYNASYFDPIKCEFVFDFITLGWWSPGGGGGSALDNPGDLPGEIFCTYLYNRM